MVSLKKSRFKVFKALGCFIGHLKTTIKHNIILSAEATCHRPQRIMRVSVCVYLCVNRGWTVLIELVSDDSGESHKKKEGMPKGSTGISFPLMSLSLSLPRPFSSNHFFLDQHSLVFVHCFLYESQKYWSFTKRPPFPTCTRNSLDRLSHTSHLLLSSIIKEGCMIVWTARSFFYHQKCSV